MFLKVGFMSTSAKKKGKKKKTGKEIAVIVFAVFIAIAMMVPSLGYIINYFNMQNEQKEHPQTAQQVQDSFTEKVKELNEKIQIDPKNANLYDELGNTYLQWASFASALPQEGQDTNTLVKERAQQALDAFNNSLAISTTEAGVVGKALSLTLLNEPNEAETVLEDYLKDHPESTTAYQMLAQVFEIKGENDKAVETYKKMKDSTSDEKIKERAQKAIDRLNNPDQSQESSQAGDQSQESSNNS